MAQVPRNVIIVSPPNLDKTGFLALERGLLGRDQPTSREWLMDRLAEGLQVRMLRAPLRGFIEFAPGRATWRPMLGAEHSVVIEVLRAEGHAGRSPAIRALLRVAEDWARYFGFSALLLPAPDSNDQDLTDALCGQGFQVIDSTLGKVDLWGKILLGPVALPRLPQDWPARAARLGAGLVMQVLGRCDSQLRKRSDLLDMARAEGIAARIDHLPNAAEARARLTCPDGQSCVALDGSVLGAGNWSVTRIKREIRRRKGG